MRNGLPYYKAYPRDFMEGTIGMPFELKGAYRLLLDLIYMQAGRLFDEPKYIAGHLGCSVRAWGNYRAALVKIGKIQVDGEFISNFRATLEMDKLEIISDKQRENASQPRKNNGLSKAMAQPKPSHTEPEPDTDKDKEEKKTRDKSPLILSTLFEVMSLKAAQGFMDHRKAKRAPLTPRAAELIADKLRGIPNADAVIENSIMNGWTGVFPDSAIAKGQSNGKPDSKGRARLDAFLAGATIKPGLGSGQDCDPSQPLLAR